jgi:hypothetical protein
LTIGSNSIVNRCATTAYSNCDGRTSGNSIASRSQKTTSTTTTITITKATTAPTSDH